jgi:hypothetical protein
MYWVYLAIFVIMGVALDWAYFDSMRNGIETFRPIKEGFGYRDLLFPRAYITVLSTVIVGIGGLKSPPHTWLIVIGGCLFMLSHFYAMYVIWRFGRRR